MSNRRNFGSDFSQLACDDAPVPRVDSARLLGVTINSSLSFSDHIHEVLTKASRSLFYLRSLKLAGASSVDLLRVYTCLIRPVLEYASPLWDGLISKRDADSLERLQRRAVAICGAAPDAISSLAERRKTARIRLLKHALSQSSHSLHSLLPERINHGRSTRSVTAGLLRVPYARTKLYKSSFVPQTCRDYNCSLSRP